MTSQKRLFLIDGMALIYRAHFAMIKNPLITKDGRHTSAIFGFMNSLFKLLNTENPDYIAIVLDSKEPTFRHELYTDYKATREKMPDELVEQLEPLYNIISNTNIPILKKPGFEADDIIGTLVKKAEDQGLETYMVTSDKDMMQLVSDRTFMYSMGNSFKPTIIYDKVKVNEKWGVNPEGIIDMLALIGDSSDNVPGIDGVGVKTAKKLLDEYNTIDRILENSDKVKNKRVRAGLENGKDLVYLSKELVTINCDVPIEFHLEEFIRQSMNIDDLFESFQDLEMFSLATNLKSFSNDKIVNVSSKEKKYQLINNEDDFNNLISTLKQSKLISFDLETTSTKPLEAEIVGLGFSIKAHEAFYIPILYPDNEKDLNCFSLESILNSLKIIFENKNISFCGQNIKYDSIVLKQHGVSIANIYFDTMIAESLLNPDKHSYKLDYLALDYLNYKMVPIENLIGSGLSQLSMSEVDLDKIKFYACEDTDVTFQLVDILKHKLLSNNLSKAYFNIENLLIKVLISMECSGVFLDLNFLKQLSIKFEKQLQIISKEIFNFSGREFNINSPKQLAEVLFDDLELKNIRKRSTAVEVLEVLKLHHPLPEKILQYRHLAKLKNTYVDALPGHVNKKTNRVHTSFNQTITSTGRLSSTTPNFQNIPIRTKLGREIRKAFIAQKKESVILSADYSQVELRIMAHFSKEPELIKAFENDMDIHLRTAALVNQITENEVTPDQRRSAKVVNFGIMYGAGPYRMSQELGINMKDAKSLIENYFQTYPGIQDYIDKTLQFAKDNGYVETLFGRRKETFNLNSSNSNIVRAEERAAINMPIQGTAADIIKIAMINIHDRMKTENYKGIMTLQIHDELLFECPKNEAESLGSMIKEEMENAAKLIVPLKVEWNYGYSWYDAH